MLAHVMLYAFFFPIASCVTSCNISYLFDNADGVVSVTDAVSVVNIIINSGE